MMGFDSLTSRQKPISSVQLKKSLAMMPYLAQARKDFMRQNIAYTRLITSTLIEPDFHLLD